MALEIVPTNSYDAFRGVVLGRGFNVDDAYGYQCWDLGATLWGNVGGYTYPYLSTNNTGYAYGIWVARVVNAGTKFELIYNLSDVKKGDMVVLNKGRFAGDESGHNAFADEDYNGTNTMWLVGQNQENPNPTTGHITTRNQMDVSLFMGAFRYKDWNVTPPTPTQKRKRRFPWFIYARQHRARQNMNV